MNAMISLVKMGKDFSSLPFYARPPLPLDMTMQQEHAPVMSDDVERLIEAVKVWLDADGHDLECACRCTCGRAQLAIGARGEVMRIIRGWWAG
jgi:hypothetical protein